MPIVPLMLFPPTKSSQAPKSHRSPLKATLLGAVVSILFAVPALAQESYSLEGILKDQDIRQLNANRAGRFGDQRDAFYKSALRDIPNRDPNFQSPQQLKPNQQLKPKQPLLPTQQFPTKQPLLTKEPLPNKQPLLPSQQPPVNQTLLPSQQLPPYQQDGEFESQASFMAVSSSDDFVVPHTGAQPSISSVQPGFRNELDLPSVPPLFSVPSNGQGAGTQLLAPYQSRAAAAAGNGVLDATSVDTGSVPLNFRGWWADQVASPVGIGNGHIEVSVDNLVQKALHHSPFIQVAATAPHILQTSVFEEAAAFDWNAFLESQYVSENDPIGNTLTTGDDSDRFEQQEWFARGGLNRRTRTGGDIEVVQRLGILDNNSVFFIPNDQANTRLELNFRQPILSGRGRPVNQSMIVLADIDFQSASDDFLRDLQLHLVTVTEAYWELVRARAVYLQRNKLLQSAEKILSQLEGRSKVDSLQRQVLRAKAAVARRKSEIARSLTSIKNAQSQLRLLVNSPDISRAGGVEFTPLDMPLLEQAPLNIDLADVMSTALTHRPDISRSIRDLHAANVRLGVSRNEVLPKLDFIVGTYVAGLDGDSDIFQSWVRQFKEGSPGYNVGIDYEFQLGNRAARARQQRREWESARSLHLFRQTVETSLTEVEVSAREVQTTYQEMLGRYHSMAAAERETGYLIDRWQTLPDANDSVVLLLEDLLDSQERLADEESAFVTAQVQYSISIVQLKQAMGTLFRVGN